MEVKQGTNLSNRGMTPNGDAADGVTMSVPAGSMAQPAKSGAQKGMIAGLVCLALIAIAGCAFGAYGMITKEDEVAKAKASCISQTTKTDENEIVDETSDVEVIKNASSGNDALQEENSYALYVQNLTASYRPKVFGSYHQSDGKTGTMLAKVDDDGKMTISDLDQGNVVLVEIDNISNVFFLYIGNGGMPYFYFVDYDGAVFRFPLDVISSDIERKVESVGSYSKIVSVSSGVDLAAHLVDINGDTYIEY